MIDGKEASDSDIVDDVFASDRDRGADSAAPEPEAVETPPKAEAKAPEAEPKAEEKPEAEDGSSKQYRDPENGRFVPLTELKTERQKRQEEARLRAEFQDRATKAEAALEEARRYFAAQQNQQHQYQQPQQQEPLDPYADLPAYLQQQFTQREQAMLAHVQQVQRDAMKWRLDMSEARMRETAKDFDDVIKVFGEVVQANPKFAEAMFQSADPARYAYEVGKKSLAYRQLGDDPDAQIAKIRAEERQKVLDELKGGGNKPQQRFPGTLSDASASGSQAVALSDAAIVDDIFSSDRRRRA